LPRLLSPLPLRRAKQRIWFFRYNAIEVRRSN